MTRLMPSWRPPWRNTERAELSVRAGSMGGSHGNGCKRLRPSPRLSAYLPLPWFGQGGERLLSLRFQEHPGTPFEHGLSMEPFRQVVMPIRYK